MMALPYLDCVVKTVCNEVCMGGAGGTPFFDCILKECLLRYACGLVHVELPYLACMLKRYAIKYACW